MNDANASGAPLVTVSPEAGTQLRAAIEDGDVDEPVLRIVFHVQDEEPVHGIIPEPTAAEQDVVFEQQGLTFVVDPETVELVRGSTIDYEENDGDGGLLITNPNISVEEQ